MQESILPTVVVKNVRRFAGVVVVGLTILLGGCETMDKASEMAKAEMPGGDAVDIKALSDRMVGNTSIDVEGKWHSYMRDDGVVLMWTESDGVKEGSWRRDADGVVCQTMGAGGDEVCMSDLSVSQKDGVYMSKSSDGNEMSYRIVSGNARGM